MFDNSLSIVLVLAAGLIIVVLASVAAYLHWQLYGRRLRNQQLLVAQEAAMAKKRQEAANSLRIIAKSYLSGQVELAEAGIRISRLMDYLGLSEAERAPYRVFDQVNGQLAHIPILKEWKSLPKKDKRNHQKTFTTTESVYKNFALEAAQLLAVFDLPEGDEEVAAPSPVKQPLFYKV